MGRDTKSSVADPYVLPTAFFTSGTWPVYPGTWRTLDWYAPTSVVVVLGLQQERTRDEHPGRMRGRRGLEASKQDVRGQDTQELAVPRGCDLVCCMWICWYHITSH